MSERTKEAIYDELVGPLMAQIIAICKEHKIATFATFSIPNEDDPDLLCTTALLTDEYEPPPAMLDALRKIYRPPAVTLAETVTQTPTGTQVTIRRIS